MVRCVRTGYTSTTAAVRTYCCTAVCSTWWVGESAGGCVHEFMVGRVGASVGIRVFFCLPAVDRVLSLLGGDPVIFSVYFLSTIPARLWHSSAYH